MNACASCLRRQRALDDMDQTCPACHEYAVYSGDLDRWVHPFKVNADCWAALTSGQVAS
jgi:hypothetical protein